MSEVWYAIPSANPAQCTETFARWKDRGYMTAVLVDGDAPEPGNADLVVRVESYPGYGGSVNLLCSKLPDIDWIVTGGDDQWPDTLRDAQKIAMQCTAHFNGTFGVMQPIGDPWLNNCARFFCGSPWLGREFRRRVNRGTGPYNAEYFHYYDDTELQAVATMLQCFWQRTDVTQVHNHWTKKQQPRPDYMVRHHPREQTSRVLFERRAKANFPGHELIP